MEASVSLKASLFYVKNILVNILAHVNILVNKLVNDV